MVTDVLPTMATNLTVTIVLEVGTAFLLRYRKRDLGFVFLVNLLTNPVVVISVMTATFFHGRSGWLLSTVIMEAFALVCEWLIYRKCLSKQKPNPFMLSLILNAVSYCTGEIIHAL